MQTLNLANSAFNKIILVRSSLDPHNILLNIADIMFRNFNIANVIICN